MILCLWYYFKEKMYQASRISDGCFFLSREAIASKCKDLKKKGKGNLPNRKRAPTQTEVKQMWDSGALGDGTPTALQHTIWWIMCTRFGKRANKENYCMEWGDIIVSRNDTGRKFLTVSERATKTRQGCSSEVREVIRVFEDQEEPNFCPVRQFEAFSGKRGY